MYTLELEHTGFVKQRIRDHPDAPPFGEKRGETKQEREREKGQSVESRMPQNATKARKILYGPGGTDWTGPMAHGQRGTVTRDTCVDQRMRVFRGVVCLNAVMSLVINMYLCVYVCIHIREEGEEERIYRRPIIIHSRDTGFGYSDEQTSVTRPALLAHSFPRAMT